MLTLSFEDGRMPIPGYYQYPGLLPGQSPVDPVVLVPGAPGGPGAPGSTPDRRRRRGDGDDDDGWRMREFTRWVGDGRTGPGGGFLDDDDDGDDDDNWLGAPTPGAPVPGTTPPTGTTPGVRAVTPIGPNDVRWGLWEGGPSNAKPSMSYLSPAYNGGWAPRPGGSAAAAAGAAAAAPGGGRGGAGGAGSSALMSFLGGGGGGRRRWGG